MSRGKGRKGALNGPKRGPDLSAIGYILLQPEPAKARRGRCPNTTTATLVRASQRVGLILPGMIKEPGSFSGIIASVKPVRGLVGRHSFLRSCIRGWLRRHS